MALPALITPAAVALAWLVPNHYLPWVSAWSDGVALIGLTLALIACRRGAMVASEWAMWFMVGFAVVALQVYFGLIAFLGDGLMAALYIVGFAAAVSLGGTAVLRDSSTALDNPVLDGLAIAICAASVASIGIALVQLTGAVSLGLLGVDMPPGGRPYANVAQPNHLCSICFLGLCSLALLRERGHIGNTGLAVGAVWMLLGMVMTGSRTGWLQMAALVLMAVALHRRSGLRIGAWPVAAAAALYALMVTAWPWINEALALTGGRAAQEVSSGGTRPLHWAAMLSAIAQEPWFGYGWQQVSVAQVRTADTQPFVGEYIEHSHNLFLDLLIWNGLPVGLLLSGILIWWFASRLARCRDNTVFWLMACIAGLAGHAMVEYPLSFAYFLIPMGFWVGAVDALQGTRAGWAISARSLQAAGVVFAAALAWVGADYMKAEQGYRLLRLESARIGATGLTTPPPDLQLLTQLEAFQRFAHTEARAGMLPEELDQMRKVSERYAYPPSLFRYALAQGLNGQPDGAALTLLRLCRIHPRERCDEGREAWASLQQRHLQLVGIDYPPTAPRAALK
jgi:O-antigen ligase